MSNTNQNFINQLIINPKRIFLIDAFGALLTTFFLSGILAQFEEYFGMPKKILYLLSGIAFCMFIYSISCSQFLKSNWKPFLRILLIWNALYLAISFEIIIKYFEKITKLGLIYFILEFIIIAVIIMVEYKIQCQKKTIVNHYF